MAKITEAQFLKDVATHELTIIRDDGLYRHLRLTKPNSGDMQFDLVTWPGWLCYCGDMGTYVFSRVDDMLKFFRKPEGPIAFDASYWAQKCQASDRSGITEYSPEKFRQAINDDLDEMEADDELRAEVEDEVLVIADDGEVLAISYATGFTHDGNYIFSDFYEHDLHEFTFRFLWCCHALVWGIRQYDAADVVEFKST